MGRIYWSNVQKSDADGRFEVGCYTAGYYQITAMREPLDLLNQYVAESVHFPEGADEITVRFGEN